MSSPGDIRKGLIPVPNVADYNPYITRVIVPRRPSEFAGPVDSYWQQYTGWWSQQNRVVQVATPALFLFAAYKILPKVLKALKKR